MGTSARFLRPVIGRSEVVETLRRRRDRVRQRRGAFTLLEGAPGVGKTTLFAAVLAEAERDRFQVLRGHSLSLENPPPFHLVREAIGAAPAVEGRAVAVGGAAPLVYIPSVAKGTLSLGFVPYAVGHGEGTSGRESSEPDLAFESLRSEAESTAISRSRLIAEIADRLFEVADEGPTLLALEDIQAADEASLEFLEYLAPLLADRPIWVLATLAPIDALPPERRERLGRLAAATGAERVSVRPLSVSEVAEFVRALDPRRAFTAEEVTRWHGQTGGNPLFLEQILLARREPERPTVAHPAASDAERLSRYLEERLLDLSEEDRRTMTIAAVLGKEFSFALLLQASGEPEEALSEIIQRLVERGVLRERPGETLEFPRDDVRTKVYAGLTETRRRILHKRAGEALEELGGRDVASVYALARHFYLGRADAKAVEYNRRAADFAARTFAPHIALLHLERALECHRRVAPGDVATELDLTLEIALQLDRVGELGRAEALLRETMARPDFPRVATATQRATFPIHLARILTDEGQWEAAERIGGEILHGLAPDAPAPVQIAVRRLLGEVLYYRGDYPGSLAHHDAALELARAQRNEREIALETVRRANVLGMIPGRFEEALVAYRAAVDELIRLGDDAEAAYTLLFMGVVLSQHRRTEEGLLALRRAAELAEKANDARRLGWSLFNIADLSQEKGDIEGARDANRRSREILKRVGDRYGLAQTYIIGGKIELAASNLGSAEQELAEASRIVQELHTEADELEVILRLGELAFARADLPTARQRAAELRARGLDRLRPDLSEDLARLESRLAPHAEAGPSSDA
jgi:tetratricopeptide (TPR) repeat protein